MTPEQRKWLLLQIEVLIRRQPNVSLQEMKTWIRADPSYDWNLVKKQTFNNFLRRAMDKYRETGSMKRRPGGGRDEIPISKVRKIKRLGMNKLYTGTRPIGLRVRCDPRTVAKYLRKSGAKKAYHRRKVQKLTQDHMDKRVRFANWALQQYGVHVYHNTPWGRLVNTDFSGPIGRMARRNSKTDIGWAKSIDSARDLLDYPQEKFDQNLMLWGGVTYKGLVPPRRPIFVDELKDRARAAGMQMGANGGVNGKVYAFMIHNEVVPVFKAMYATNNAQQKEIWQDDNATIHRCHEALQACLAFNSRVPHDLQAAKMADLWPVENLWGLLQERVKRRESMTKEELRRYIEEEWCKIDDDKALCRRFMQSIPKRLQAVVAIGGRQIRRTDYKNIVAP